MKKGIPSSEGISFLCAHSPGMFDEIKQLCDANGIAMTIYVDDTVFCSIKKSMQRFGQSHLVLWKSMDAGVGRRYGDHSKLGWTCRFPHDGALAACLGADSQAGYGEIQLGILRSVTICLIDSILIQVRKTFLKKLEKWVVSPPALKEKSEI